MAPELQMECALSPAFVWHDSPVFTLKECLTLTQAKVQPVQTGRCQRYPKGVVLTTDTRLLAEKVTEAHAQGLAVAFMPLVGERFDGHTFLEAALEASVDYIWVATSYWHTHQNALQALANASQTLASYWLVSNTLLAYQGLARGYRKSLAQLNPQQRVIALTGSSGKTTVKNLLAKLLNAYAPTHASAKNHNNDIGVVQTLFQATPAHTYVVVEMGMRGLGEIRRLAQCALPDMALTLNVGPAHIGLLGSLEAIAEAKCEIAEGLFLQQTSVDLSVSKVSSRKSSGYWFVNEEDTLIQARVPHVVSQMVTHASHDADTAMRVVPFGGHTRLTVSASHHPRAIETYDYGLSDGSQTVTFPLALPGRHHALNVAVCLEVIHALDLPLEPALEVLQTLCDETALLTTSLEEAAPEALAALTLERWQILPRIPLAHGGFLHRVFDAYNANPASMQASLTSFFTWLAQQPYTQTPDDATQTDVLLVLGAMEELGPYTRQYHIQLGRQLAAWMGERPVGWHRLFVIGTHALPVIETLAELGTCPPVALCDAFTTVDEAREAYLAWLSDARRPVKTVFLKGSRRYQLETLLG
jgi:UDP-N-acetylmuramyl pentapeptide synthase